MPLEWRGENNLEIHGVKVQNRGGREPATVRFDGCTRGGRGPISISAPSALEEEAQNTNDQASDSESFCDPV